MKKIVLLLTILSLMLKVSGQGAMSGDGMFIASVITENGQPYLLVHKFMTKELIRKIAFKATKIDEVKMSETGKFVEIKTGSTFMVWDILQEKRIITVYNAKNAYFSPNEDFLLVLKPSSIVKYDLLNDYKATTYSWPNKDIYRLRISPDGNYFVALGVDRVFVYSVSSTSIKKTINGKDADFSSDSKSLTVLTIWGTKVKASVFDTKNFYQQHAYISDNLLTKVNASGELIPSRCSLSKNGKHFTLYTAKQNKVEIFVFSSKTGRLIWTINNFINTDNELYPQMWASPDVLIAYGQKLMAGEYNVMTHTSQTLGLRIDEYTSVPELSLDKQQKIRKFSPNYHYVVVQVKDKMYVRDSRLPHLTATYENTEFLCFSPDSKYLIVKKDNSVNVIVLSQLSKALQHNTKSQLYTFDRTLSVVTKENLIPTDAKPPKGYAYFYANNTKQIVKVDTAKLHYVFKSIKVSPNQVELQVNLVDAHGNEFLGATDPSWKYIWCNLIVQNPNGTVGQINNYSVEEVMDEDPTAYALVLDHSGSMGDKRANILNAGAKDLVLHKRKQDAFMLVKYDNHVKILAPLTKNPTSVVRYLGSKGLAGFGGGTALIDATYYAIKNLEKADYPKKSVILFTDGYENASLHTKYELLQEAVKNHIQINVIGFGKKINEDYLKSIAYNTGGMYIHLYKTKDMRKVFRDVDFKRRHYYKVKFNVQQQGKHIALLQLCQDFNKHDSLWVPFDNSVTRKRIDKRDPVFPVKPKQIRLTQFNQLKIPTNPPMKPVKSRRINKEFDNIHFPNILFATGSDRIVSSEQKGIDEIVNFMRKYPYVFLEIDGHTDNQGTPEFNMDLSRSRAKAAKELIVKAGIAPGRIITRGFGDTKPIASNDTEEGKAKNRRIEFKIFVQK